MNILVTGGAGYIGSHTVRALMKSEEFTPFVFDNLSTGHRESVPEEVAFIEGDIHDIAFVAETMKRYMGSRRKHLLKKIFPIIRPMCMAGRNLSSRI